MANLGQIKKRSEEQNREQTWQKTPQPEAPYQNKKTAGETITVTPLKTSLVKYWSFRRPVYNEKKDKPETTAIQNLNVRWAGKAKGTGKTDPEQKLNSWNYPDGFVPPPAEEAMLKLSRFALQKYRDHVVDNKVKHGTDLEQAQISAWDMTFRDGNYEFWSNDKGKFGYQAVLIGNEIVPFTLYKETVDPTDGNGYYANDKKVLNQAKALAKSEFVPRNPTEMIQTALKLFPGRYDEKDLKACRKIDDLLALVSPKDSIALLWEYNKGIKQFYEETHDINGVAYFKYPKYLTAFQLIAQIAQAKSFGKDRLVWKPVPMIPEDYQKLVPAEFEDYVLVHLDDVDIVRGYLANASNWSHPVPAFREYPNPDTGEFVFVSLNNPDLVTPVVNIYEGYLGDTFSKAIVKAWSETPEFFGFEPATQETLTGGMYYEHPQVEFEFPAVLNKEKRTIKATAEKRRVYGVTIQNLKDVLLQNNKPTIRTEHGFVTLEWQNGLLWERPLNLNRQTEDGNLAFGSEAVISAIKAEADVLGVPYRGKPVPKPYWPLKDHPDYVSFVAYAESKGQKVAADDSEEPETGVSSSKAKDIDV